MTPLFDTPSSDPGTRLQQIRTITSAYKSLTLSEPILPSAESPLPALLAVRSTLNLIEQSKKTIREAKQDFSKAQSKFRREDQCLKDAQHLSSALETRIQALRLEQEEQSKKTVDEIAMGLMQDQQQRKAHYAKELRLLVKGFNRFVNEHLAVMLAAEELGGPVVGDNLDLDEDALKAGFTHQGKAKKPATDSSKSEMKRRRRNDEIWGGNNEGSEQDGVPKSEKEAAAANFRSVTERLLNAAAGDEGSDPYIKIARESSAVRFLVRSKVATFHPEDARRIRLRDVAVRREQ